MWRNGGLYLLAYIPRDLSRVFCLCIEGSEFSVPEWFYIIIVTYRVLHFVDIIAFVFSKVLFAFKAKMTIR